MSFIVPLNPNVFIVFFSSFLLLGNLQMRADISENQSWRGRKDDFV